MVDVPLNACVAALGEAKCKQTASAGGSGSGSLISLPVNVCAAVLGEAECQQKASGNGGLVDVPLNACIAALGEAKCKQSSGSSTTSAPSAPAQTVAGGSVTDTLKNTIYDCPLSGSSTAAGASFTPAPSVPASPAGASSVTASPAGPSSVGVSSVAGPSTFATAPYPMGSAIIPGGPKAPAATGSYIKPSPFASPASSSSPSPSPAAPAFTGAGQSLQLPAVTMAFGVLLAAVFQF